MGVMSSSVHSPWTALRRAYRFVTVGNICVFLIVLWKRALWLTRLFIQTEYVVINTQFVLKPEVVEIIYFFLRGLNFWWNYPAICTFIQFKGWMDPASLELQNGG